MKTGNLLKISVNCVREEVILNLLIFEDIPKCKPRLAASCEHTTTQTIDFGLRRKQEIRWNKKTKKGNIEYNKLKNRKAKKKKQQISSATRNAWQFKINKIQFLSASNSATQLDIVTAAFALMLCTPLADAECGEGRRVDATRVDRQSYQYAAIHCAKQQQCSYVCMTKSMLF